MNRTALYLMLCSISFMTAVILCVWLQPADILSHDGLSFYGNFEKTLLPYGLGLVATAYFLLRACHTIEDSPASHSFKVGLEAIAIALLGIVATPSFSHSWIIQDLHVIFGFVIFVTQAILSLHYLSRIGRSDIDWGLLGLQMIAIVLVALSFHAIGILNIMLPAQILATVSFGTLLIRAVNRHAQALPRLSSVDLAES